MILKRKYLESYFDGCDLLKVPVHNNLALINSFKLSDAYMRP